MSTDNVTVVIGQRCGDAGTPHVGELHPRTTVALCLHCFQTTPVRQRLCTECELQAPGKASSPTIELCFACLRDAGFTYTPPAVEALRAAEAEALARRFAGGELPLDSVDSERARNVAFFDTLHEPRGAYALVDYQRILALTRDPGEMFNTYAHRTSSPSSILGIVGTPWAAQQMAHLDAVFRDN